MATNWPYQYGKLQAVVEIISSRLKLLEQSGSPVDPELVRLVKIGEQFIEDTHNED